jgi:CRP/FNR family cyclic AMP-dependent transcriptional regulator
MEAARLGSIPLFSELNRHDRQQVAMWADEVTVEEGTHLVREGDFAHEFFVIEEGTARVEHDGATIAELGPGDFFGEIGLLDHIRRTASVTATSPMRLVVMFEREFGAMAAEIPAVAEQIHQAIRRRCAEMG